MNIIDSQTVVISVDLNSLIALGTSKIQPNINLRFAADELVLKSIVYTERAAVQADIDNVVQIWCSVVIDGGLIGSFPNNVPVYQQHNERFRLTNTFQSGGIVFEFQQTALGAPSYCNPQAGIVDVGAGTSNTNGIVSFTIEFLKTKR